MNQQVVFLSDGGDTVRDMQAYLSPESEHLLDWFHITTRLRASEFGETSGKRQMESLAWQCCPRFATDG